MYCIEEELDSLMRARGVAVGQPSLLIEEQNLRFFVDNGFKVEDMAFILGRGKRTVERRLQLYGLSTQNYSTISDSELDEAVLQICSTYPRCGEKLTDGKLCTRGIHVTRESVRESLRRIDPA